jgi:Cu/Ag efflux protein CusF
MNPEINDKNQRRNLMRNKIKTSCLFGIGMLAVTAMSYGQNMPAKPSNPESGAQSKASEKRAMGDVTSVDAKTGKLSVKTAEQDLSLNVEAQATKKSLESIKVGDKVSVSYRDQGGTLVASSVNKAGAMESAGSSSKTK